MTIKNYQIFAEEAEQEQAPEEQAPKYTDADVDRIIGERFARWEKQHQEKEAKKIAEAEEAEKLKHMTEAEKTNRRLEEMESRLKGYQEKEARSAMEKAARKIFQDADLNVPDALVSVCVAERAEDTKENVDRMVGLIRAEAKRIAESSISKATPKTGEKAKMTKEQIFAVKDPAERQRLIAENWEFLKKG